jgi:isopenicillin N synthase-like dioxygenase
MLLPPDHCTTALWYPSRVDPDLRGCGRGFLTVILQDGVGGLEVKPPGRGWLSVPAREGALVVNCGDYLSLFASTLPGLDK